MCWVCFLASPATYHLEISQEIIPLRVICGCRRGKTLLVPILGFQLGFFNKNIKKGKTVYGHVQHAPHNRNSKRWLRIPTHTASSTKNNNTLMELLNCGAVIRKIRLSLTRFVQSLSPSSPSLMIRMSSPSRYKKDAFHSGVLTIVPPSTLLPMNIILSTFSNGVT